MEKKVHGIALLVLDFFLVCKRKRSMFLYTLNGVEHKTTAESSECLLISEPCALVQVHLLSWKKALPFTPTLLL